MAFSWANVLVPPTGSSGLSTGSFADVDEALPWNDADFAALTLSSLASGTAIFSGFDLSNAGGEKKSFYLWARMSINSTEGFNVTITVKATGATIWTSSQFLMNSASATTYLIKIPDSAFSGDPAINDMSVEFAATNLRAANQSLQFRWLRISKTPFTTGQQATLPASLTGQEFTCYRSSDLAVLGAVDGEAVVLLPDASGNGRHAILKAGTATFETDGEQGVAPSSARFIGALGFDTATGARVAWSANKVFHFKLTPTTGAEASSFSTNNSGDFFGSGGTAQKHILGIQSDGGGGWDWVLMSGDGTGPAHLAGGTVANGVAQRVTEWVQVAGGNEKMWENDAGAAVVNGSSGDNPFSYWSLMNRESDDRPLIGRWQEAWFIEGTDVTEAEIDSARSEWVNGPPPVGGGDDSIWIKARGRGGEVRLEARLERPDPSI